VSEVDDIVLRLIAATRARNSAEMLRKLGFSSGLASQWRRRGVVPDGALAKAAQLTGVDFHWLRTGEGGMARSKAGDDLTEGTPPSGAPLDRDLLIEAASIIKEAEIRAGVQIRPDKLGELILMLYDEYASGAEVTPEKIIKLVRLAA